jgi:hypothetical protein
VLDDALVAAITGRLRSQYTVRHVPDYAKNQQDYRLDS